MCLFVCLFIELLQAEPDLINNISPGFSPSWFLRIPGYSAVAVDRPRLSNLFRSLKLYLGTDEVILAILAGLYEYLQVKNHLSSPS